jgi:hypothetical protein
LTVGKGLGWSLKGRCKVRYVIWSKEVEKRSSGGNEDAGEEYRGGEGEDQGGKRTIQRR